MRTRIISGLIALGILLLILFSGKTVFALSIFAISLVAIKEIYNAGKAGGFRPSLPIVYASSIAILISGLNGILFEIEHAKAGLLIMALIYIITAALLVLGVFKFGEFRPQDIGFTLLSIFYVVFMFSFIPLIRNMENGIYIIWIIFIGAWGTDTIAYFSGVTFGKHKILPKVSPKKSLEGSIGGALGCMLLTLGYGYFLVTKNIVSIPLIHFAILGLLNGILSQVGDWIASAIKRTVNIKDYGKIMPGHGGILDRFDSILFIAPILYLYFSIILNYV